MKLFLPPVAKGLTDTEYHEVKIKQKHKVRVTPFLNGNITNLKVSVCQEAVVHEAGEQKLHTL